MRSKTGNTSQHRDGTPNEALQVRRPKKAVTAGSRIGSHGLRPIKGIMGGRLIRPMAPAASSSG